MGSKGLTIYGHARGPNPLKVIILAEFLKIPYTNHIKEMGDGENGVKAADFLAITPNGRVPAIVDHANNDFVLWESAAIMYYLTEKYDTEGKFGGKTLEEKAVVQQWLAFQISGLGPVQGNINFFNFFHKKPVADDIFERFTNETKRVYGVLEGQLSKQPFIALDRLTSADIAFFVWVRIAGVAKIDLSAFPKLEAWVAKLAEMPEVKTGLERTAKNG